MTVRNSERAARESEQRKNDLAVYLAHDLMIKCDVDKMQRVFDNLLHNAVNYSFEGSTIDITVAQDINTVNINFLNHGNTIPKEIVELHGGIIIANSEDEIITFKLVIPVL